MIAHYDLYDYQAYWKGREYEHESEKLAIKRLFNRIKRGGSWLEVGAGFGRTASLYASYCDEVTLLDPSSKNLASARKYLSGECFGTKFNFIQGKAESLPFANSKFSGVVMVRVLHHLPDPLIALQEISRVIKPDGYLVLEFANKVNFKNAISNLFKGRLIHTNSLEPEEKRSAHSIAQKTIPFVNHHPNLIKTLLEANDFHIISSVSVSNLRSPMIKKLLRFSWMLKLEKLIQTATSRTNIYFGPSIFILARKDN